MHHVKTPVRPSEKKFALRGRFQKSAFFEQMSILLGGMKKTEIYCKTLFEATQHCVCVEETLKQSYV